MALIGFCGSRALPPSTSSLVSTVISAGEASRLSVFAAFGPASPPGKAPAVPRRRSPGPQAWLRLSPPARPSPGGLVAVPQCLSTLSPGGSIRRLRLRRRYLRSRSLPRRLRPRPLPATPAAHRLGFGSLLRPRLRVAGFPGARRWYWSPRSHLPASPLRLRPRIAHPLARLLVTHRPPQPRRRLPLCPRFAIADLAVWLKTPAKSVNRGLKYRTVSVLLLYAHSIVRDT